MILLTSMQKWTDQVEKIDFFHLVCDRGILQGAGMWIDVGNLRSNPPKNQLLWG